MMRTTTKRWKALEARNRWAQELVLEGRGVVEVLSVTSTCVQQVRCGLTFDLQCTHAFRSEMNPDLLQLV